MLAYVVNKAEATLTVHSDTRIEQLRKNLEARNFRSQLRVYQETPEVRALRASLNKGEALPLWEKSVDPNFTMGLVLTKKGFEFLSREKGRAETTFEDRVSYILWTSDVLQMTASGVNIDSVRTSIQDLIRVRFSQFLSKES